jgi:predicted cobalt transporter CbtA
MDGDEPHTEPVNSAVTGPSNVATEATGKSDAYGSMPKAAETVLSDDEPSLAAPGSYFDYAQPVPVGRYEYRRSFLASALLRSTTWVLFLLFFTALLILAVAGIISYFLFTQHPAHPLAAWLTIFGGVGLCIGMFWLAIARIIRRSRLEQIIPEGSDEQGTSQDKTAAEDPRDRNQRRIEEYNKIAWSQARGSYRNSQIAMSIGLALLVAGVITTIRQSQTSAQLVVGGLTGLGSAVSAYLGATFIRIYNEAVNQMNYYYGQPLVTSYLLEAERMSKALEKVDTRDKVMERVIDATLAGAAEAGEALSPNTGREKTGRLRSRTKQEPSTMLNKEAPTPPGA